MLPSSFIPSSFIPSASYTMAYTDASNASIDTESFVISTDPPTFRVDSDILGTTIASSNAWQVHVGDNTIKKLLKSIKTPVYHILTKEHYDMGYDNNGRRCHVVDFIDVYVCSSKFGKQIVYLYEVDKRQKSYFLRDTAVNPVLIKSLSIEDDYGQEEMDDTFAQVYRRISDILISEGK